MVQENAREVSVKFLQKFKDFEILFFFSSGVCAVIDFACLSVSISKTPAKSSNALKRLTFFAETLITNISIASVNTIIEV